MMKTNAVKIGNIEIGGSAFVTVAGPCSVESLDQLQQTASFVQGQGASILRGGLFKLRTRPDSFQGLGVEGFDIVHQVKNETGMPYISEITDTRQVEELAEVVDAFQVGSRNMHNYALLKELGKTQKPILLKRGFSGLIDEWIHAADYIASGGNENVILCERGIRTFETKTRNTFDINAIAYIKQFTPFPIIADPSHGTGMRELVTPIALAAVAAGADGMIVEVHPNPKEALSDGYQALNFEDFNQLMNQVKSLAPLVRKEA
ncbi:MAG: 3-deoxy-7-phosphoheptulonate synthase [Bdellovibrionales bacterium]